MSQYIAVETPVWVLVFDERPPENVALHLLTNTGMCVKGPWTPEHTDIVAWRPLPKLTSEQKRRLIAIKAAGLDPSIHKSSQLPTGNDVCT